LGAFVLVGALTLFSIVIAAAWRAERPSDIVAFIGAVSRDPPGRLEPRALPGAGRSYRGLARWRSPRSLPDEEPVAQPPIRRKRSPALDVGFDRPSFVAAPNERDVAEQDWVGAETAGADDRVGDEVPGLVVGARDAIGVVT
jgi:hypothetical protein